MAGVTFLAFGNGSPDVFSTFAAMNSHSGSLAVGELIGAAGFITAVVAGSMALVREFKVGKKTFVRDVGFFIVAVSFSMVFLADGALHLWECCVMIAFYVFYVITVVVWHWYLGHRRQRNVPDGVSREEYTLLPNEELEVAEEDDYESGAQLGGRRSREAGDLPASTLNSAPRVRVTRDDGDDDDEAGIHLAAEMANSMRVARPRGARRNTITPIRPSLVGALEFRSVLASLQKTQDGQIRQPRLRPHSADRAGLVSSSASTSSVIAPKLGHTSSVVVTPTEDLPDRPYGKMQRARAATVDDPSRLLTDQASSNTANVPNIGIVAATPTIPLRLDIPSASSKSTPFRAEQKDYFNSKDSRESRESSSNRSQGRPRSENLLLPDEGFPGAKHLRVDFLRGRERAITDSPNDSPKTRSPGLSPLSIPRSSRDSSSARSISPISDFPTYTDSPLPMSAGASSVPSLILPEADVAVESPYESTEVDPEEKPLSWWPYRFLPSPYIILSTLFPTLCGWKEKTAWDKFVSVASAPSILLLSMTLPVVETESGEEEDEDMSPPIDPRRSITPSRRGTTPALALDSPTLVPEDEPEWDRYRRSASFDSPRLSSVGSRRSTGGHSTAAVAVSTENRHHHIHPQADQETPAKQGSNDVASSSQKDWNRWLIGIQIYTGPLFVMLILWANGDRDPIFLAKLVSYSLAGSSVVLAILLLTTTADKAPKFRFLLCFVGFVVSIAWISTIANEVVGVLKAFGVVLDISDAILGLTIFAVGNSLGDLVADITVARLGYPVMALSACFGGPMLNILLGVGISGLYMTIKEANHKHEEHPGKRIKYKPYEVEVSGTLLISAVTLLITLLGLLIAVPWNRWIMSKRIGWGLIGLWVISTIINLAAEVSGVWKDPSIVG